MRNVSADTVTITDVRLRDSAGLEVVGAIALVPDDSGTRGIVAHGWPPPDRFLPKGWEGRQDAEGYRLSPGTDVDLWVAVEAPTGAGAAAAIEVEYQMESGATYVQHTVDALAIVTGRDCKESDVALSE